MDGFEVIDRRFAHYVLDNAPLEELATGFRWVEGLVWMGDWNCLLFEDLPRNVKVERLSRLIELSKEISLEENYKWIGREVEVLVNSAAQEEGFVQGHTRGNHVALVKGNLPPGIHHVHVAHATPNRLYCTIEAPGKIAELNRALQPSGIYETSFAV